jgi:hypothetical protein
VSSQRKLDAFEAARSKEAEIPMLQQNESALNKRNPFFQVFVV